MFVNSDCSDANISSPSAPFRSRCESIPAHSSRPSMQCMSFLAAFRRWEDIRRVYNGAVQGRLGPQSKCRAGHRAPAAASVVHHDLITLTQSHRPASCFPFPGGAARAAASPLRAWPALAAAATATPPPCCQPAIFREVLRTEVAPKRASRCSPVAVASAPSPPRQRFLCGQSPVPSAAVPVAPPACDRPSLTYRLVTSLHCGG